MKLVHFCFTENVLVNMMGLRATQQRIQEKTNSLLCCHTLYIIVLTSIKTYHFRFLFRNEQKIGKKDMNPKISIIGTGNWGKILTQKFHQLGGLHRVYGHRNREVLEPLRLRFTEDIDALIEESDAVVVATPSETHAEFAYRVLSAKKDLFLEKPIALSSAEAADLAELADTLNRIFMVGHTLCYSTGFQRLNALPGDPVAADAIFLKTSTEEQYLNAYWNFGIHMVALAVALNVPPGQFTLEASDQAPLNQRTFASRTQSEDGNPHSLAWDFLAPENQEDMLMVECQHFVDCLNQRQKPRTDAWQGVQTIQALEDIHPEHRK